MHSERTVRGFDPFRALTPEERNRHLAGYLRFLEQHDGSIDFERRTLSRREMYFEELRRKPVEWQGPLDREAFGRNFASTGCSGLDRRTAWLVVAAKANSSESYGVDHELRRIAKSGEDPTEDELHLRMLIQEKYHTRILLEACRTAGIEIGVRSPHWNQRVLIHIVMRLPDSMRWVPVICAEIVGCAVFEALFNNVDVFSSEPDVEERVRSLLTEIWRDEILHVAYLRARVGPIGLAVARRLLPLVTRAAMLDLPQLAALGTSRAQLLARARSGLDVPPDIIWMQPDPEPVGLSPGYS